MANEFISVMRRISIFRFRFRKLPIWSSLLLLLFCLGTGLFLFFYVEAGSIDLTVVGEMPKASILYDCHGKIIYRYFEENRIPIPGDHAPELLKKAIIAKEDKRFYEHSGFDFVGTLRAAVANFSHGGVRQGGSTITQQLARNSIGRFERTFHRKILEIFLARRIEQAFTKEEILLHYLNRIYYGRGLYGAETASQAFFGKRSADLNLGEAALLAGIVSAPNSSSPWTNFEAALRARARTLTTMESAGFISEAERKNAEAEPLTLKPYVSYDGDYYVDEIHKVLETILSEDQISSGGLQIFTTIDYGLQDTAEKSLRQGLETIEKENTRSRSKTSRSSSAEPLEGAVYIQDRPTGAIRALVGGRDYKLSKFNRATQARRQAGSTLKPLLYACAFEELGYSPVTWIENTPFDLTKLSGSEENPSGNESWIRINDALVHSDNYAAVRVGKSVGPELFLYYAQQCGIHSGIPPYPSSYLGACEVTLADLTEVYATLANQGVHQKPFLVVSVRDQQGTELYHHTPESTPVFSPPVAFQVSRMLENVIDFGTARAIRSQYNFSRPAAGKTGTTDDYRDAWFVGYTSSLVGGVWVGYDQPEMIMAGGYGSRVALPIWTTIFDAAQHYYPMEEFEQPAGLHPLTIEGDWTKGESPQLVFLRDGQQEENLRKRGDTRSTALRGTSKSFWDTLFGRR